MSGVDVGKLEQREELADQGQHIVRDVFGLGTADEESGLGEADLRRVLEGEVAEVVKGAGQDG